VNVKSCIVLSCIFTLPLQCGTLVTLPNTAPDRPTACQQMLLIIIYGAFRTADVLTLSAEDGRICGPRRLSTCLARAKRFRYKSVTPAETTDGHTLTGRFSLNYYHDA